MAPKSDEKRVPQFSSFKPKSVAFQNQAAEETSTRRNPVSKEPGIHLKPVRSHEKDPVLSGSRGESRRAASPQKPTVAPSKSFTVDLVGNIDNVKYASLDKYAVPSFRRYGRGSILGLGRGEKIDRDLSTENKITTSTDSSRTSLASSGHRLRSVPQRGLYVGPTTSARASEEPEQDFVSFESRKRRKRNRLQDVSHSEIDSDSEASSDLPTEADEEPRISIIAEQLASQGLNIAHENEQARLLEQRSALSQQVQLNPGSGVDWLKLIRHHDQWASRQRYAWYGDAEISEAIAAADLKASLTEKALKGVKEPLYREALLRIRMREGSRIWDNVKLSRIWKDILSSEPQYSLLMMDYLGFAQLKTHPCNISDIKDVFATVMERLQSAELPYGTPSSALLCYALLRLTTFLKEAGYTELAVAIWQANLEIHNFRSSLQSSELTKIQAHGGLLMAFEEFWESELPRLGEDQSTGWKINSTSNFVAPEPLTDTSSTSEVINDVSDWEARERASHENCFMPARTMDDTAQSDPYRAIMFSDIRPFLVLLDGEAQYDWASLVDAFLSFCGVPPLSNTKIPRLWWQDPLIRNQALYKDKSSLLSFKKSGPFTTVCSNFAVDLDMVFDNNNTWFSAINYNDITAPLSWFRKTLRQLVDHVRATTGLVEYHLALEAKTDAGAAKKLAKSIIKRDPANIQLYNSFASIEATTGTSDSADAIFSTVISLTRREDDLAMVWVSRIWNPFSKGDFQQALDLLVQFRGKGVATDDGPSVSDAITRVQTSLIELRDRLLRSSSYDHARHVMELLVLLEYLSSSDPLGHALKSFEDNINLLPSAAETSECREKLHQSRARILYTHMLQSSLFSPSTIRAALQESIFLFPCNTIFLHVFAFVERRFRIDDRIRSTVQELLVPQPTLESFSEAFGDETFLLHYFAIENEIKRAESLVANVHSIRSAFERAVRSEAGCKNAGIWKWYCVFECEHGQKERALAVFYRAIGACPWVKELHMVAFGPLRKHMSMRELKGVYETMQDRDIRIRIPLDEFFARGSLGEA